MPDAPQGPDKDLDPTEGEDVLSDADERLQKTVERIEKELDRAFEGRLDQMKEVADANRFAEEGTGEKDLDARLVAIESKARDAKGRNEAIGTLISQRRLKDAEDYRGLGVGLSIAYAIVGFPLLGAGAGYFIDRSAGTGNWMGICAVIGAAVGMLLALMMLARQNQSK